MFPRKDERSGRYGYWRRQDWVIPPRFEYARNFHGGYAHVDVDEDHSGLIATDGMFFPLESLCGGRTPNLVEYGSVSFQDYNLLPSRYATVRTRDHGHDQWGLIDTSLNYTPLPDEVFSTLTGTYLCGDHLFLICKTRPGAESSIGLFNLREMRLELPCEYSFIYTSPESLWVLARPKKDRRNDRGFAFYDTRTQAIVSDWLPCAMPFWCGLGAIQHENNGTWQFVDESLNPAFDGEFDNVERFSHGLAGVYQGSDAGYIDTTGQMRLLLPYDDLKPFNEFGLAIVSLDDEDRSIIDRKGHAKVTGLDSADFWAGDFPHFEVTRGEREQLLDTDLKKICDC